MLVCILDVSRSQIQTEQRKLSLSLLRFIIMPALTVSFVCRPFLMDLQSTNGSFLNGKRLEPYKYYEIREKDVVKFGHSTRDYVFLTEESVNSVEAGNTKTIDTKDVPSVEEEEHRREEEEKMKLLHAAEGEAQFEERRRQAVTSKAEIEAAEEREYEQRKKELEEKNYET